MSFRVELDTFRGPLDLLLYLVRKHEVDVTEIAIAPVARQFLDYWDVLRELRVDDAGEFLVVAGTLLEMKSERVLPRVEASETVETPREELVRRLLEYKQFRDAASMLDERGRRWQQHFPRLDPDDAPRAPDLAAQPLHEVELWDLVSAFSRLTRDRQEPPPTNIVYDDTPLHVYMQRVHARLVDSGRVAFGELFEGRLHKSALCGMFLALLELARRHGVTLEQADLQGEIWLTPGAEFDPQAKFVGANHPK